ncbi:hypothetical protein FGO68_gene3970 [Halteria grandinella]|uniref:protein disulfide-isomerase n=1 Tax=Halteria grandinella TaxID=5974 RepID=A0A8J8P2S8_HALGN|nr:hypothetical protein FGO68_gene3970 [Halteria grandinella]
MFFLKQITLASLLLLCLSAALNIADVESVEGVLVLTDANFDDVLQSTSHLLVEFYAPWCGNCQQLASEYAKAAQSLASFGSTIRLAKVDATVHDGLAERFQVQGLPALYWFKHGVRQDYSGGRTEESIIKWVVKHSGPSSLSVATCQEVQERASRDKLALAYVGDFDKKDFTVFMRISENPTVGEKYQFYHTADFEGCGGQFGTDSPSLVLFRNFDTSPVLYSSSIQNINALLIWLQDQSVPTLIEFSEDYIEPIFGQRKLTLFLFRSNTDKEFSQAFSEVAQELRGQLLFVTSGVTEGILAKLGDFMGLDEDQLPTFWILDAENDMRKYSMSANGATVESIKKFIEDFKQGKLSVQVKSQEIPEDDGRFLKTIVGKNFREKVLKTQNEVFIRFYAPYSGHCNVLAPIWESLAEEFRAVEGLVIAVMDGTANEPEGVDLKGFPSIKFYKNGIATEYEGGREFHQMRDFLKEHSIAYQKHLAKGGNTHSEHSEEL